MGTGLAKALGVAFRDTDRDIERTTGKSISEIFIDDGEEHFRLLESVAVAAALASHDGILALGGGAVLDAATRAELVGHRVIWLQVDLTAAARRVGLAHNRPVLAINPRAHLRELLTARTPLYAEVATDTVAASRRRVGEIVEELRQALSRP